MNRTTETLMTKGVRGSVAAIALALCLCAPAVAGPYEEGIRDYYKGLCYRARPYILDDKKNALWERGYRRAAQRDRGRTDLSHCEPRPSR
jgi:hypothetical protein